MKKQNQFPSVRDLLAVLIAFVSLAGLGVMLLAEGNIALPHYADPMVTIIQVYTAHVLPSLQRYSLAFGAILLAVSISLILLGHEEEIATTLNEQNLKK